MWAKISTPATAIACAACIATAATLPVMGTAAERAADEMGRAVSVKLSALSVLDAFGALPLYEAFLADPSVDTLSALLDGFDSTNSVVPLINALQGDLSGIFPDAEGEGGIDAISAVPSYLAALGDPTALTNIDAFSAVPSYLSGQVTNIDAFSALGAPFIGTDAFGAVPNIVSFATTGDLSRATGLSGIDAFSGLPALNAAFLQGDIAALAPSEDADGNPVGGWAALSAVPGLLDIPAPAEAPDIPAPAAPATMLAGQSFSANLDPEPGAGTGTPTNGANLRSVPQAFSALVPNPNATPAPGTQPVPAAFSALVPNPNAAPAPQAAPAVQQITPPATVPDNSGADSQNIVRDSKKFTPGGANGNSPILWGTANRGVEGGMPGWQAGLKSLGLAPSGATPGGATPGGASSGTGQGTGTG